MMLTLSAVIGLNAMLQVPQYGEPTELCKITRKDVNESSGIAASHEFPGVYYTHNDSGDTARYFKFNSRGTIETVVTLRLADAVDWEDMATARIKGVNWMFFADIGDNSENRKDVTVYRMPEPTKDSSYKYERMDLTYPDGPHNAECFFVNPANGDFYIVTKTDKGPSGVYWLASPKQLGAYRLRKVGSVEMHETGLVSNLITGGDASPDGSRVVLRTYQAAYEYAVGRGVFDSWMKAAPTRITLKTQLQGEGICYSADGNALVTSSEGTPCPIDIIQRR